MLNAKSQRGESLIELLLVIFLLGIIVMLLASLPNAMNLITKSKRMSLAREIVTKQIEDERRIKYIDLANGSQQISDSRISLLPHGSGTVTVEDCDKNICTDSENVKQVTVIVNWQENNKDQQVSLKTFIGKGGLNQ